MSPIGPIAYKITKSISPINKNIVQRSKSPI